MMQVIRANACRSCKFVELTPPQAGDNSGPAYECHRYPPVGGPVVVPIKPGMMSVQIHCGFPRVQPDFFCGEHKPRLQVMANEAQAPIPLQRLVDGMREKAA